MKSILVTGGCGFIGSSFIRLILQRDAATRVVNLDKLTYAGNRANLADLAGDPRLRFVHGDIIDAPLVEELFATEEIDAVVNFAAESHVDRSILQAERFIRTNVLGTQNLLEVARRAWSTPGGGVREGVRFLQVSTDEVFGSLGPTGRFHEGSPYDPRSPYSASKAAADHLVRASHHTHGLPTLISICSNNYGPRQFPEKLIPLALRNAYEGRSISVYGDGENIRDWLFVTDHCAAILAVLTSGEVGETYCIGASCERRNIEVVEAICDLLDEHAGRGRTPRRDLIAFVADRPGHDRRYAIDASRITRELGWTPSVPFEDGLRRTIEWSLAHPEWIRAIRAGGDDEEAPPAPAEGKR